MESSSPSSLAVQPATSPSNQFKRWLWIAIPSILIVCALAVRLRNALGTPAADPLHGNDEQTPAAVAAILAKTPSSQQLPLLLKWCNDRSYGLRYAAIDALRGRSGPGVLGALEHGLQDSDAEVRKRALEVLVQNDPGVGIPDMLAALHDEDSWVREDAATQLAISSHRHALDQRAVPALVSAVTDPDRDVAQSVMNALVFLTGKKLHVSDLAPEAERLAAARKWQSWWASQKPGWKATAWENLSYPPPDRADLAPDFVIDPLNGSAITRDGQKGRVTLINFWAPECGPCVSESDDLEAVAQRYRGKPFDMIGVCTGVSGAASVSKWCSAHHVDYIQAISNKELEHQFGSIDDVPDAFLIDQQGRIRRVWQGGPRYAADFEPAIDSLLGTKGGA